MATFKVTLEKIGKVWTHPNADALDLAQVEGMAFQFVMARNTCKPGDVVVYFPLDSLLPPPVLAVLPPTITAKLSGPERNRIKTVKLRSEISQGLAVLLRDFPLRNLLGGATEINETEGWIRPPGAAPANDLTEFLGVVKYEPPVVNLGDCELRRLPPTAPHYDIEGCDRFGHLLERLMEEEVVITEKLEGTNTAIVCEWPEQTIRICQRSGEVIPLEGAVSIYHEGAKREDLPQKAMEMAEATGQTVTLRGELLGPKIQDNHYRLPALEVRVFEVWLNGHPIDWHRQTELTERFKLKTVPVLFVGRLRDFLAGRTVQACANGPSALKPDRLREGIVIRPTTELPPIEGFGRPILKQRSAEYLVKSDC
jgi:RNA ligase (TIGR02306 family)